MGWFENRGIIYEGYKSDHPESEMIDTVVSYFQENDMLYKAISDGQAIVVSGDQIEIID